MEHYRRSVELRPDFSIGMFSLAQCYALQGDHRRAVDWIKRAVQIPQGLPGKILIQLVDESKAIGEVDAALEVLAAVRPDWEKDPSYFVALGRAHAARGDEAEAVRWFEHARALDPGNPLATEELLNRYVAKRDMEGLARLIKSAWDASAGSIQTLTYLGLVSLRAGQGRIAEEIFRKVLESDPQNGDLLVNLAMALQIQGRSREAREALEAVLALEPANPEARRMLDALDRR
jgi:Flp pilus assembly protein TadD